MPTCTASSAVSLPELATRGSADELDEEDGVERLPELEEDEAELD